MLGWSCLNGDRLWASSSTSENWIQFSSIFYSIHENLNWQDLHGPCSLTWVTFYFNHNLHIWDSTMNTERYRGVTQCVPLYLYMTVVALTLTWVSSFFVLFNNVIFCLCACKDISPLPCLHTYPKSYMRILECDIIVFWDLQYFYTSVYILFCIYLYL